MTEEEKKAQEEAAAAAAAAAEQNNNPGGEGGEPAGEGGEGGEGGENKPAEPAEKTPKELVYERVRTSRPDGKYDEDEQEIYRQLTAMLDEAEDGNNKYKGLTDKMMRRYKDDPEEVAILLDYMEGMPLLAAIRKHKGDEGLTIKEGDEGWEEYQAAGEKRKADRERYENMMAEMEANMGATVEAFKKWAEDNKIEEEQQSKVWEAMNADLDKMSRGIFDAGIFDRYYKAENYENDVEGAHEQGKAEGKNEAIDAKREEMKGSGLPGMSGGSAKPEEELSEREKLARKFANFH